MNYKRHPVFKELKISEDGTIIKENNIPLKTVEYLNKGKYPMMLVYLYDTYFSLSKLVMETYNGYPTDNKRYFTKHKDKNPLNTHPENLYWSNSVVVLDKDEALERALKNSKLSKDECFYCYAMFLSKNKTLKDLSKKFNVSDMSIYRAVKRIEKYLNN